MNIGNSVVLNLFMNDKRLLDIIYSLTRIRRQPNIDVL